MLRALIITQPHLLELIVPMSGQNTFPIHPLMFSWSPAAADCSAVVLLTKANVKGQWEFEI